MRASVTPFRPNDFNASMLEIWRGRFMGTAGVTCPSFIRLKTRTLSTGTPLPHLAARLLLKFYPFYAKNQAAAETCVRVGGERGADTGLLRVCFVAG